MQYILIDDPTKEDTLNKGVYMHAQKSAIKYVSFNFVGDVTMDRRTGSIWRASVRHRLLHRWQFVPGCDLIRAWTYSKHY